MIAPQAEVAMATVIGTRSTLAATEAGPDGMIWLDRQQALLLQFDNNGSSLPAAEMKLNGLRPYLRIEQDMHDVLTGVLLVCTNGVLTIHYGIVTTLDPSAMRQAFAARSYLVEGSSGAEGNGSVLRITRPLTQQDVELIALTRTLDGSVDGRGGMRFGTTLDMGSVQDDFLDYGRRCFTN